MNDEPGGNTLPARFGEFELDTRKLELRRSGEPIPLEPRPLRLLLYLFEHRDRILSKQELFAAVWPDEVVGDAALAGALRNIRRALDDDGNEQRWIRTRRRVGYQFIGPVASDPAPKAIPASVPARRRIFGAPRGLSMCFVGRDSELAQLEQMLALGAHMSVQVAVEGLAGIGKTELVLQLAHRVAHADRFPAGIFWLDAQGADLRSAWGGEIAEQYGIRPGPVETRCAALLRALENEIEPLLVVLDNVEQWRSDARPWPLPRGPHVSILVATRRHNLAAAQFKHLELGLLAPPHDRELLTSLAGPAARSGLEDLLSYLGGHALGLELAGAFLGTFREESPRSYLAALQRSEEGVASAVADRVHDERTLTQSFRTVWDQLPESVRNAWWLASFFEAGPVSREIALAAGIGRDEQRALESVHLIQCDREGLWTMHRLVREFGHAAGPEPPGALSMLLAMGPKLVHRRHGGAELRSVYQRAVELADQTAQIEEVLRALDGLWHARCFQAAWQDASEVARMIDVLTAERAPERYRLTALRAWGGLHFYTGSIELADTALMQGVELCRREPALTRTVTDAGVFVLCHAALTTCLRGFPARALALMEEAEQLARGLLDPDPATLTLALFSRIRLHILLLDLEPISELVERLQEINRSQQLPMFEQITAPTVAWARLLRTAGDDDAALAAIEDARGAVHGSNTFILMPVALTLLAEACSQRGYRELGLDLIDDALRLIETTGERHYEVEIWRVRAALSKSRDESIACLERALEIADFQPCRWFALRCATDLVEISAGTPRQAAARERLRALHALLGDEPDRPDIARARRALDQTPG